MRRKNLQIESLFTPRSTTAHNVTFNQIDLSILAEQLSELRVEMEKQKTNSEQDAIIEVIKHAESEAKKNNRKKVLEYLSKAGQWSLGVAQKIGVPVAVEAMKRAMLPE